VQKKAVIFKVLNLLVTILILIVRLQGRVVLRASVQKEPRMIAPEWEERIRGTV
jgi:hypothetical protein